MSLSELEQNLFESMSNMLESNAKLGLAYTEEDEEDANTLNFMHETIKQEMHLKTAGMDHADSINSAFSRVHSFRHINNRRFPIAFNSEMKSMAVPEKDRKKALELVEEIVNGLDLEDTEEQDHGYHKVDELKKATQPTTDQDNG